MKNSTIRRFMLPAMLVCILCGCNSGRQETQSGHDMSPLERRKAERSKDDAIEKKLKISSVR